VTLLERCNCLGQERSDKEASHYRILEHRPSISYQYFETSSNNPSPSRSIKKQSQI